MTIEHIAPEDLLPSKNLGYSQVVKTDARTTVYIAGQGAVDKEIKLVGAGAFHSAWDGKPFPPNASSMIGVERLMLPGMLVEISAVAVIDEDG
jgi:enamine deaminase RidA (YjgF/YER057c/UK114 family)